MSTSMTCEICGKETSFGRQFEFFRGPDLGIHIHPTANENRKIKVENHKVDEHGQVNICNLCIAQERFAFEKSFWITSVLTAAILLIISVIAILFSRPTINRTASFFPLVIIVISGIYSLVGLFQVKKFKQKIASGNENEIDEEITKREKSKIINFRNWGDEWAIRIRTMPYLVIKADNGEGYQITPIKMIPKENGKGYKPDPEQFSQKRELPSEYASEYGYFFLTRKDYGK